MLVSSIFSPFPTMFSKAFFLRVVNMSAVYFYETEVHDKLFTKQQNFRPVQNERLCRQQNKRHLKLIFWFGKKENIVGKGENAGFQHFLLFPRCFQKLSFLGSFKVGIVW